MTHCESELEYIRFRFKHDLEKKGIPGVDIAIAEKTLDTILDEMLNKEIHIVFWSRELPRDLPCNRDRK